MAERQGSEWAYLCCETWRRGGKAQKGHGNHRLGYPGHGTPCLGRAWKEEGHS